MVRRGGYANCDMSHDGAFVKEIDKTLIELN